MHDVLVNTYIADARAHSAVNAARLAYLEDIRAGLSDEVKSGAWEVTQTSFDGSSSNSRRLVSPLDRLRAVMEAIEILTADSTATRRRRGLIIPRYSGIPHP